MTFYQILHVRHGAKLEEIQASFRELAAKYHPDRQGGDIKAMTMLTEAWTVLKDEFKRLRYDTDLEITHVDCPVCQGEGRRSKQQGFKTVGWIPCAQCHGVGLLVKEVWQELKWKEMKDGKK